MVRFSNVFLSLPAIAIMALVTAAPLPQSRNMQLHNNEEKMKHDSPIFSDNSYTNFQRTKGGGPSREDAVEHGFAHLQPTEEGTTTASATTFSVGEPGTSSSTQEGPGDTSGSSPSSSPETTSSSSSPAPHEPEKKKWTTTLALTTAYVLLTGLACVAVVCAPEEAKLSDALGAISP